MVVTVGSSAPEPGTWALMLTGFAGLGAALRRRPRGLAA
ncbi:MAG TPA: PEPxxWA-CTERM sorting domain-containing protein [Thermoanaerobaculia bacterium]|nr:PEPxxWA-CTERM sorting domain-containing protein [Thermoanaerobaculia bacterium]